MTDNHPITLPPELRRSWFDEAQRKYFANPSAWVEYIAEKAARWGADQELEACEKYWMTHGISPEGVVRMREARRPQPLSLKEQALAALAAADGADHPVVATVLTADQHAIIRRALEQLDD